MFFLSFPSQTRGKTSGARRGRRKSKSKKGKDKRLKIKGERRARLKSFPSKGDSVSKRKSKLALSLGFGIIFDELKILFVFFSSHKTFPMQDILKPDKGQSLDHVSTRNDLVNTVGKVKPSSKDFYISKDQFFARVSFEMFRVFLAQLLPKYLRDDEV